MRLTAGLVAAALASQAPAQTQTPTFRSGVELVEVAVIVRDKDGGFVSDLTARDFELYEQGVAQKIVGFDRVSLPVERPASGEGAVASDVSSNERIAESRVFVLVLDALHVASRRTLHVRRAARQFLEKHVGTGDLVAVISPGGLESATQDFTTDRTRLLAAIDQFAGSKLGSAAVGIAAEAAAVAGVTGGMPLHDGKDADDAERMLRAASLGDVLAALARHMSRVERRRKALLLFSEGLDYNTGDVMGLQARYSNDIARANSRAIGALMRANVSVYAIDPRGLSSAEGDLVEMQSIGNAQSLAVPRGGSLAASVDQEYTDSIVNLRQVSESTGGFAAVDTNSFAGAFDRIVDESSRYYVLGYAPEKPMKPGEFREIDVRVKRPGLRVVARKGHAAPPAERAARMAGGEAVAAPPAAVAFGAARPRGRPTDAAVDLPAPTTSSSRRSGSDLQTLLASPIPLAGLPMRLQAIPVAAGAKRGAVQLVVEVLGAGLEFAERGGRFEERVDLALLTVDSRAKSDNGRSTTLELRLAPEDLPRIRATGVRWLSRLEVAPGRYQVRVAARAVRNGATGLVTADVEVPRLVPDRPALGGVTLTSLTAVLMETRGDKPATLLETPPSAARTFVAGDRLTVAVEVYAPPARQALELVAQVLSPDGAGPPIRKKIAGAQTLSRSEQVAIPIETATLAPGSYALQLLLGAPDAAEADRIERLIPFEIAAPRR